MNETQKLDRIFDMVASNLALDFTNTVGGRKHGSMANYLDSYQDVIGWSRQAGTLTAREAERLLEEAEEDPSGASEALRKAIALREAIYRIFSAVAAGNEPSEEDLTTLNALLSEAMSHSRVVARKGGFKWEWLGGDYELESVLWPVARSAAELLTSGDLSRVRECSGETCGWLFVDTSRNRSRRWCDMSDCGNRAKVRRYYQRKRTGEKRET